MEVKDVLRKLRAKHGYSQEELADRLFVTRQAVSRWENGETIPNTETLKLLSNLFDVSINTLLGAPRKLLCQCCGMPLDDSTISREPDGAFNEDYCKWCYSEGKFVYNSLEELMDFLVEHMSNENWPAKQARAFFEKQLPTLNHWNTTENRPEIFDSSERFFASYRSLPPCSSPALPAKQQSPHGERRHSVERSDVQARN